MISEKLDATGERQLKKLSKTIKDFIIADDVDGLIGYIKGNNIDVNMKLISGSTILMYAVSIGGEAISEALINNGANVNDSGDTNDTPLHVAAAYDEDVIAGYLIGAGANLYAMNNKGLVPFHVAVLNDSNRVATCIVKNNFDVTDIDKNEGRSYLCIAKDSDVVHNMMFQRAIITGQPESIYHLDEVVGILPGLRKQYSNIIELYINSKLLGL